MMIDVARARADTPGCEHVLHFDNAGAALMPKPVVERVISHLRLEEQVGGYRAAAEADDELAAVKVSIAELLGAASSDEIAVTENATRAWDLAFYGLEFRETDRILTSESEYASNYLAFLQVAEHTGCDIVAVPNTADGDIDVEALSSMVDERVKLIAINHVPTNNGVVHPAAAVGAVARAHDIVYLLDATQSVGQIPLDVQAIGCDLLAATSRKYLRGPRGVGFLWVRQDLIGRIEPPMIDLLAATWTAPDEYRLEPTAVRFETWEGDVAGRLGLGVATRYATGWGIDAINHWVTTLADVLRDRLSTIPRVTVRDVGRERCGIVSFTVAGMDPDLVALQLAEHSINVSASSESSALLDMRRRGLKGVVRASVHYYNTEAEVDRFAAILTQISGGR